MDRHKESNDPIPLEDRVVKLEVELARISEDYKFISREINELKRKFDNISKFELIILVSVIVNLITLIVDKII